MTRGGSEAYHGRIEAIRDKEYPQLKGQVYLDHAGTTLYAKSHVDRFAADMASTLFGNPHSFSASSQSTTARIEDVRLRLLQFFRADPSEFDLVFVANATAGIKLVTEAFRGNPDGFHYAYHAASHTSVVGVREEARSSLCVDNAAVEDWLVRGIRPGSAETSYAPLLFAYPAQSNMDGRRFPMDWGSRLRRTGSSSASSTFTLMDAAAYAATSQLDFGASETAPDFTVLSLYKIFGFPDLGALIVRRQAASLFQHRKYFGGGTVDMAVVVGEQCHASKDQSLHESLEDGTLPIHSIVALGSALDIHRQLFGTMTDVSLHTSSLARKLHQELAALEHGNGSRVCTIYSPNLDERQDQLGSGPIVAFNLKNEFGAWASLAEFEKLAVLKAFHVRTGGLCNPGGITAALGLEPWEVKRNFSSGYRCGNDNDIIDGKPTGVIRVSLGAMSTASDVDKFVAFVSEFYRVGSGSPPQRDYVAHTQLEDTDLYVEDIVVYPIKSCGGYRIPKGVSWEVRPEGLAWDREWCLVHRGSGEALSQKRHPRMALIRPSIDFTTGNLQVSFAGGASEEHQPPTVYVPLATDPAMFQEITPSKHAASRVCGEEISAHTYKSCAVNDFFTNVLGVQCALARFPAGGQGKSMRHAKAHLQRHQHVPKETPRKIPGSFPGVLTPPDSDTDSDREQRKILLANESPILAISLASLEALNGAILKRGGKPVSGDVFRANIIIGTSGSTPQSFAYSEDHWSKMRIGQQYFEMMGSCRRCHMVCIDQATAIKSEEPFVTLTKTRRFDGKVFFGTHMCHLPSKDSLAHEAQHPTIQVGDKVAVDSPC